MDEQQQMPEWLYAGLLAGSSPLHYLYAFVAVALMTLVGHMLAPYCGSMNISLLYLLPVLIAAVRWGRRASFFACILGVVAFDYFFVPPTFDFTPADPRYYFILTVYLIVAVVTGTIAARLRSEKEHLRALSSRLESIREEERTAVAREIHDELGQALTGIKLDLAQLAKKLPDNEAPLIARVKSLGETVDDTIKTVRRIATDLRPGILDELGLTAAIEWQVEDFAKRMETEYDLSFSLDDTGLDRNLSTTLFRILQEALTNIARHAHATNVKIDVKEEAGFVIMQIEDDGCGVGGREIDVRKSLGLLGIRERVRILNGEAHFSANKKKGASLWVRIPISRVNDKHA